MQRIVVTRHIPDNGLERLAANFDVHVADPGEGNLHDEESLVKMAKDANAMITMLSDPITRRVISALPRQSMIAQFAVGYDNVDIEAARRSGVVVTNTPGVLTDATADFAMALLLATARQIPAADAYVRDGRFQRWETMTMLGVELSGKVMGILGLGRIGAAVARRALGFGMEIIYHNRRRANPTIERETAARYVSFDELLSESDIISIHASLNEDSRHLFNEDTLGRMKDGSLLINTGRGSVIDEAALVRALQAGKIAGAGLDVFENEPDVHPGLLDSPNVVLAPHLGSATRRARNRMSMMCAESVEAFFDGDEKIPHRVV